MAVLSHHIVHRQSLSVEVEGAEVDGLALQRSLPGLCRYRLTPVIEQALDRYAPLHGLLSIERLDIDAGTVTLDGFEQALIEAVQSALEKLLRERVGTVEYTSTAVLRDTAYRYKTTRQTLDEAFVHFLKTATLPPSLRLSPGSTLEQALLDAWQEARQAGAESSGIAVAKVLVVETARQRLVRQFSPTFLETLLALISPQSKAALEDVFRVLHGSRELAVDEVRFERQLWEAAFADAATRRQATSRMLVAAAWGGVLVNASRRIALANLLERHWPGVTHEATGKEHINTGKQDFPTRAVSEKTPAEADDLHRLLAKEMPAEEVIYIDNAGLVLLHPFLPQFFSALGIVTDDCLSQIDRALCLLHYLVTGQPVAPEYALSLPKILCGMPLTMPVESDVGLKDEEKAESDALLEAVIRHWSVLRNTSPDGLRGSFLLRPGKLSVREGDWLLQVEPQGVDILLGQLPWGFSMIKLPWMEKMLWVEWG